MSISGAVTASFVYNGDGRRVKATVNGTITPFAGAHYGVTNGVATKYYFAGTQRVAMRKYTIPQSMMVEYFLGDHLGSTSLTTDNTGAKVSEMRYKPWGEVRSWWTAGLSTNPNYKLPDYSFTGQFSHMDDPSTTSVTEGFGLMFYNARWYDPYLGRFAQADSIIPGGVQGLDRYAYTNNSPLKYTDPSGHETCDADGYCGEDNGPTTDPLEYWKDLVKNKFGVKFSGNWTKKSVSAIYFALFTMNNKLKGALKSLINGATFLHAGKAAGTYGGATWQDGGGITFRFNSSETAPYQNVYHEVAHLIDIRFGEYFTETLDGSSVYTEDDEFVMGR